MTITSTSDQCQQTMQPVDVVLADGPLTAIFEGRDGSKHVNTYMCTHNTTCLSWVDTYVDGRCMQEIAASNLALCRNMSFSLLLHAVGLSETTCGWLSQANTGARQVTEQQWVLTCRRPIWHSSAQHSAAGGRLHKVRQGRAAQHVEGLADQA